MSDLQVVGDTYTQQVPTFGENAKRIRTMRNLTQAQVAERLGVHQGQLSNLESGKSGDPTLPTILRLARVLGCQVEELVEGTDPEYDEAAKPRREYHKALERASAAIAAFRNAKMHGQNASALTITEKHLFEAAIAVSGLRVGMEASGPNAKTAATLNDRLASGDSNIQRDVDRLRYTADLAIRSLGWAPAPAEHHARLLSLWDNLTPDDQALMEQHLRHLAGLRAPSLDSDGPTPADPAGTPVESPVVPVDRRRKATARGR